MSEYQKLKARAEALHKEKEADLKRELAFKAEKDKQLVKDEEERKARREAQAKEARRLELKRANDSLIRKQAEEKIAKEGGVINGAGGVIEWNPFAEDETPRSRPAWASDAALSKTLKPRPVLEKNGSTSKLPRVSGARSTNNTSTPKEKGSPPPLGRKEKAARLFAQKATKATGVDSMFSIRDAVDSKKGDSPPPPSSRSKIIPAGPMNGVRSGNPAFGIKRGKKDMGGDGLRKLCPDRATRDRRTIDEIQMDIKMRKGGGVSQQERKASSSRSRSPLRSRSRSPLKHRPKLPPVPTTARPLPPPISTKQRPPQPHIPPITKRRPRSISSSSTSSSSSTPPPPRKRPRDVAIEPSQAAISAEIRSLFRRPGTAPKAEVYSDEESDMEAGLSDVEAEERRAAAIARREDEVAEREERERRLVKERMKREKEKGKAR